MPPERNGATSSKLTGAGTPPHPAPPKAPMEHAHSKVPEQVEAVGQLLARLGTMEGITQEELASALEAINLNREELIEILAAFGEEIVSQRVAINKILVAQTKLNKVSMAARIQARITGKYEKLMGVDGAKQLQVHQEERPVQQAQGEEVELQPGDDDLPGEGEGGAETKSGRPLPEAEVGR